MDLKVKQLNCSNKQVDEQKHQKNHDISMIHCSVMVDSYIFFWVKTPNRDPTHCFCYPLGDKGRSPPGACL